MTTADTTEMSEFCLVLLSIKQSMASQAHRDAVMMRDHVAEMPSSKRRDAWVRMVCELQAESAKRSRDCRLMRGLPY